MYAYSYHQHVTKSTHDTHRRHVVAVANFRSEDRVHDDAEPFRRWARGGVWD
jgi:hypothetical protein